MTLNRAEKRLLAVLTRDTESELQRLRQNGRPPWNLARFQLVSSLDERMFHSILGRDFRIPASPEQSLRWYRRHYGAKENVDSQGEALRALQEFERGRRRLMVEIVTRIHTLTAESPNSHTILHVRAYAVIDGRIALVREREMRALDSLLDRAAKLIPDAVESMKRRARAGGR